MSINKIQMVDFPKIKSVIDKYILHIRDDYSDHIVKQAIQFINKHIRKCILAMKKIKFSVGEKKKIITQVGELKRFKVIIKMMNNKHTGSGLKRRSSRVKWQNVNNVFNSRVTTGVIINLTHKDPKKFLDDAFPLFKREISKILKQMSCLKVNFTLSGDFIKKSNDGEIVDRKYFSTPNKVIDSSTDLASWYNENAVDVILNKLGEFEEQQSGWALSKILLLEVAVNEYVIGNGSSFIPLPQEIARKKACINVQNNDEMCFFWSIISALYPVAKDPQRVSKYPHYSTVLNTTGLNTPMDLHQISKFEKLNNISINVYTLELNQAKEKSFFVVVPARLTTTKRDRHVNLLLIQDKYFPKLNDYEAPPINDDDETEIKFHYCWIKDMSRLFSKQMSNHRGQKFFCDRCLNYFSSQQKLNDHTVLCEKVNDCKISFPTYDYVEFRNYVYKQKCPFIIFADFESLLEKCNESISNKTTKYQKHIPFSAGYYFKCSYDDSLSHFKSYRGEDCMKWFANELSDIAKFVESKIKNIEPMTVPLNNIGAATTCHICEKPFAPKDVIVYDHNHYTGAFRGFAHQAPCNVNFRKLFVVPITFHNLSGYDSHFIIRDIAKKGCVSILPSNKEKYISFTQKDAETKIKFRFIDSFRFMGTSLDELVSTLDQNDLEILKKEFSHLDEEKFALLTRKGVFPYDYIDSMEKLNITELPSREEFYNKLNDEHITEEKYVHAQNVWESFEITNLGSYADLYLKTDILLLADVFENFRQKSMATYGLDPAWYYTMPGYTWDAMLKYTKCKLQILKDIDMIMFVEKGIRGGISVCSNRYSEANNKYMEAYNPEKPSKYLLYLDVNNLYGWAMSEFLPYDGFQWVENFDKDITEIPDNASEGYILEVDLEYPERLHDSHKDFPFCPEHQAPPNSKQKKLMGTLYHKDKYILHYRNLKQALKNGLILTKIHRVVKFKQSAWLRPYIELNTRLRAAATSSFGKNLYKLMVNAIFGKTMENIRLHRVVKLVNSWNGRYGAKNLIASPRFQSRTVFDTDLVAIELKKTELVFNKPLYIGMAILDISKTCMFDFHYDFMVPTLGIENCKLMYTDTDSFIYEITCEDVYSELIKNNLSKFDTSDYSPDNKFQIPLVNKKIPGLMKDEANGKIITHFAGLRSKMYTYKVQGGKVIKKSKGIRYNVVRNKIDFKDYMDCLRNFKEKICEQFTIRSYAHSVFSIKQVKIGLSPHDDKRKLIPKSSDTLPWGHYSLK
ncbi:uncharacterized protein [Leptinotarsa decemlineata]|uniref:uncharacterized protein n=1 Tax=Leptinotarsa decemlineata TaxID=7539 RepID=UPI003D30693D